MSEDDQTLSAFMRTQIDHVVRDMAGHVGDQIFDVLRRNGLAMLTEAAATGMMVITARDVLEQAIDQCSRAAEEDCRNAVILMWVNMQSDANKAALRAALEVAA